MDQEWGFGPVESGRWYALRERLTFSVIVILIAIIIFIVSLRIYVRWYLLRQLERRGAFRGLVLYEEDNQAGPSADRGLDQAVIESLPVFLYSSKNEQLMKECVVCLSEFEENESVRLLPKCDHSFHVDCIDTWLYSHSSCPICRSKVEPVANQPKPVLNMEPGSSLRPEPRQDQRNLDVTAIITTMSVRTEVPVPPPREVELESEVPNSSLPCQGLSTSHRTRLSSFKRLLSTGRKPPIDGGETTVDGQGTSHGSIEELDLEGEPSQRSEFTQRNQ